MLQLWERHALLENEHLEVFSRGDPRLSQQYERMRTVARSVVFLILKMLRYGICNCADFVLDQMILWWWYGETLHGNWIRYWSVVKLDSQFSPPWRKLSISPTLIEFIWHASKSINRNSVSPTEASVPHLPHLQPPPASRAASFTPFKSCILCSQLSPSK